jgi:hypothetical protein
LYSGQMNESYALTTQQIRSRGSSARARQATTFTSFGCHGEPLCQTSC